MGPSGAGKTTVTYMARRLHDPATGRVLVDGIDVRGLTFETLASAMGVVTQETYLLGDPPSGLGRLRDVFMHVDGDVYVTTSNCDGRGECPADGDRVVRLTR